MANQIALLAGKKIGTSWEAALITDNEFGRAFIVQDLTHVLFDSFSSALETVSAMEDGTKFNITLTVVPKDAV